MNIHRTLGEGRDVIRVVMTNATKMVKKRAYCMACGQYIFSYYDEMSLIIDGHTEPQQRQIDVQCLSCKTIYQIC